MELNETTAEGAMREAWEEARARIEIDCLLAVYEIPRISQVQLIYRARLRFPEVEAGPESLEVGLFRWDEIPWDTIAFPTVRWALNEYDSRRREHEFSPATNPEPEPPPPVGL
jgi:ADP-ribose pyrophosphatase YjhB (NUDIX family)